MDYDLKVRGATIVDGTGAPGVVGDVAVAGGRIAAVGDAPGDAREVIDGDGLVVTPGFVDIHTHYDAQVLWDPMLTVSPWHGVTSVVMGNCGFSIAPTRSDHRSLVVRTLENVEGMSVEALETGLGADWGFESFGEYLDVLDARPKVINVASMVGHTAVRLYVLGEEATERAATGEEVARMRAIVADALRAGAAGFATSRSPTHVGYSGKPVPSRVGASDEVMILAQALGDAGRGVFQATVGADLLFDQFAEITRTTGRPVTWTALLGSPLGPGSHRPLLERSEAMYAEGLAVRPQVACRPLMFEFQFSSPFILESMPPFKAVSAADLEGKKRIYADPAWREELRTSTGGLGGTGMWSRMTIAVCPTEPALEERLVTEVAAERGVDPVDLALDLALASNLEARFRFAVANYDEAEVDELLHSRAGVLGLSDAGAHASQLCDACFSTHLLGHWVRERGSLTVEEAVRKMTSEPADLFGLADRGRLAPGLAADLVVFDPATVGAGALRRVWDLPAGADRLVADAAGIEAVVVNGTTIRRSGKDVVGPDGPLPGRVLRSSAGAPA